MGSPALEMLEDAEEKGFRSELAQPVSPRTKTGWDRVDDEIDQLSALPLRIDGPGLQGCRNRCVGVLEALS